MKYDLKKIILKKDIKNLFHELFAAYDNQITIVDASYEYIFGSETVLFPENKMPLKKDSSDIVGYVYGPSEFNKCCMLIQHLIKNEYEKKELADDSIERYRELNLFYSISNNFSSVADIKDIALALLEKISKVISVSGGAIVLYDNETNETNIIADIGVSQKNLLISEIMTFFKKEIFVNGNPFLMNQINELSELSEIIKKHIHSLILIPMKQKNKITGTMFLWNNGVDYLSNDLKNATAVAAQASFVFENIKLYDELRETFSETVKTLMTTLEKVGNEHAGHSENVSRLSLMIAEKMSLPKKDILYLKFAALLHDIGKVGKLTQLKNHPVAGADIVSNIKKLNKIVPAIRHHHENYDGTGYPDKLYGNEIPLFSRIIAVADYFDHNCESKYNLNITLKEIEKLSGVNFDPEVVKVFLNIYEKINQKQIN